MTMCIMPDQKQTSMASRCNDTRSSQSSSPPSIHTLEQSALFYATQYTRHLSTTHCHHDNNVHIL